MSLGELLLSLVPAAPSWRQGLDIAGEVGEPAPRVLALLDRACKGGKLRRELQMVDGSRAWFYQRRAP